MQAEKEKYETTTEIASVDCDLQSFDSVREAGKEVNELVEGFDGIDVLINNAGIAYFPEKITENGYEVQMQVNHLSHFLLTSILFKSLENASEARGEARVVNHSTASRYLVNFSSDNLKKFKTDSKNLNLGGNNPWGLMSRYAQSKVNNCLFTFEFNRKVSSLTKKNIFSVLAEPGLSSTGIVGKLKTEAKQDSKLFKVLAKTFDFLAKKVAPLQSAADGSMPLIKASFGEKVKANDFYAPSGFSQIFGIPTKVIDGGKSLWMIYKEHNITNEKDAKAMWKLSEDAIESEFFNE